MRGSCGWGKFWSDGEVSRDGRGRGIFGRLPVRGWSVRGRGRRRMERSSGERWAALRSRGDGSGAGGGLGTVASRRYL